MNRNFLKITGAAALIAFTMSCKDAENEVEASDKQDVAEATMEAVTYNIDTEASNIAWVGSKPTEDHTGNISLQSGMVMVNGEALESGEFVIDMGSIEVTDLEGDSAQNLKSHLEETGNRLLFAILAASASYIAVPAAMKLAAPKASPSLYIPMALAITFPFNITFGMPLYLYIINLFP